MIKSEAIIKDAEIKAKALFSEIECVSLVNQKKVIDAFRDNKVSSRHFTPSTGYGYDDISKITLCQVYASVFKTEKAIVSPIIASGTHALTIALFGLLKPGDSILSITGNPYDTLMKVINGDNIGSLKDYNISYSSIEYLNNSPDIKIIIKRLSTEKPTLVFITRSRGYSLRNALSIDEIKDLCKIIKSNSPNSIIFVDNCYGEFVDKREPCEIGADVVVGSLIKNPGGGIAPSGGYIAGKEPFINKISNRVTAPSLGLEIGSYNATYIPFYQGFFFAPSIVENAMKTNILAGFAFEMLGYETYPKASVMPNDIIRAIKFDNESELIEFIRGVQYSSPVDSYVVPYPWEMPGYSDKVIMAAGSFIQGGSIELSADAPIRVPYIAYFQGGLTYQHGKLALLESVDRLVTNKTKKI
ncbi:MAG: methionine gamma-lyase family protein [Christensenellaceae bacterium]|jgi:cystathionine beta-lyase family protein involved in aluminum resistance|nr:methionine gamma-lyase family protein [Christensenellaceae bacterium]